MINKPNFKFYIVPALLLVIIILIILIVPMGNKKTGEQTITPTQTTLPTEAIPTHSQIPSLTLSASPTNGPTPTLIPLRSTGGDLTQDLPTDVKLFSEQKTMLRRLTPLTLPFGTISFDYENDKFTLTLIEPKNQSQTSFNTWLKQTYPAITADQFSIVN